MDCTKHVPEGKDKPTPNDADYILYTVLLPRDDFHDWNLAASSASFCLVSPCIRYWRFAAEYPSKFNFTENDTKPNTTVRRLFVDDRRNGGGTTNLFPLDWARRASGKICDSSFRSVADAPPVSDPRNNNVSWSGTTRRRSLVLQWNDPANGNYRFDNKTTKSTSIGRRNYFFFTKRKCF